jgi:hypothetical protein
LQLVRKWFFSMINDPFSSLYAISFNYFAAYNGWKDVAPVMEQHSSLYAVSFNDFAA